MSYVASVLKNPHNALTPQATGDCDRTTYNSDISFAEDPRLPFDLEEKAQETDIPGASGYQRGHMTTASHRSRSRQDNTATYLMSNVIPQPLEKPNGDRWTTLENYLTALVNVKNKEFYIIAGRDGQAVDQFGTPLYLSNKVSVPENVWKVVLVLDKPGLGISDLTKETLAFAVRLPNTAIDYTGTDDRYFDITRDASGNIIAKIPKKVAQDPDNDWTQKIINVDELEYITGYNFLSNIPIEIQEAIEKQTVGDIKAKLRAIVTNTAPLMAATNDELTSLSIPKLWASYDSTIRHSSLPNQIPTSTNITVGNESIFKISFSQNGVLKSTDVNSSTEESTGGINMIQVGSEQIGFNQITPMQVCGIQTCIPNSSSFQIGFHQDSTSQIGTSQIGTSQIGTSQIGTTQSDPLEIKPFEIDVSTRFNQFDSREVTLPKIKSNQQLVSGDFQNHDLISNVFSNLKYSGTELWQTLFDPSNPFDLTLEITDLPTGQLAEAQITQFDPQGRPNSGTILIDNDANGVGWFIDPTPLDNTEFSQTLADTAFRATTGEATGKYDLLTTILHEMGHLAGIIAGNPGFDRNVQTINGAKTFVGDNFTATLTPDGSHLDSKVHPYDLMNNTLAPGVRKLPSWLNLQMVNAIRNTTIAPSSITQLKAPLSAILLAEITNGNFTETNTTKPEYGWSTRGAATILNKEAVLTEDSPFNSNFSQSFIIPEGAKYLQFTLKNTTLGASTPTSPGDAFEVALLNANTKASLLSTVTGLTQTDSLLNIQNDGTAYTSNKVSLVNATPDSKLTVDAGAIKHILKIPVYLFSLYLNKKRAFYQYKYVIQIILVQINTSN
jgi:DNA/RNA endonuclease G (NUC1)